MEPSKVFILFSFLVSSILFQILFVNCTQFEIGDKTNGWEVPKSKNDQQMFNEWASKKLFKVDDAVYFSYKKNTDSVLVVSKEDYEKCSTGHPVYVSNDGSSVVILDRPGLFYFISGVAGHCEKGQKMIIKVLDTTVSGGANPPDQALDRNATALPPQQSDSNHKKNNANGALAAWSSTTIMFCIVTSLIWLFYF